MTRVCNKAARSSGDAASPLREKRRVADFDRSLAISKMNSSTPFDNTFPDRELFRPRANKRGSRRRGRRLRESTIEAVPDELSLPGVGTMARTKRLILAALRVWELKRGIRD
jgi:hypothetical protein